MTTMTHTTNGQIRELTREEGRVLLDREAQRYLQMSAEQFIKAWEAGDFDDDPDRQALACVTNEILLVRSGYHPSPMPHSLTLSNSPAILGRDRRLALKLI